MQHRYLPLLALMLTLIMILPFQTAYADGIVVPEPPPCGPGLGPCPGPSPISQLAIRYHHVEVEIEDQVATTHVDQVFQNDNDWPVEGTYIFPLPEGAAVNDFRLWIDGESVQGEVLSREQARQIYEEIVRSLRDPALLEYIDQGALRASVFPIPPGGERRIELEYTQVLPSDNGLVQYRYPLNTEKFSTKPLEEVTITVRAHSSAPIRGVYSPSHALAVEHDGEYRFTAGHEATDVRPDQDFLLYYTLEEGDIGLNLITYRDPESEDPEGFFLLLAAPRVELEAAPVPKDVILVLDKSGSMDGEKFRQAQAALRYILEHLNADDRFNILAFSTDLVAFSPEIQPASEAEAAIRWTEELVAAGSTDIHRALMKAMEQAQTSRPTMILFVTDGLPTEGQTDIQTILQDITQAAPETVRLFSFGLGYDVNTYLLDSLSQQNRGTTTYVKPDQPIDEALSSFYRKISSPVLTDVELDFGGIRVFELYPQEVPDLFAGSQLVLLGRYRSGGNTIIELRGMAGNEEVSYRFEDQRFGESGGADFLPRLWATRKIGALLQQIRLEGPEEETIKQIVRLSIRYGIITPYTSFLVTEPNALGAEAQEGIAAQTFAQIQSTPTAVVGEKAVGRAWDEAAIRSAEVLPSLAEDAAEIVKHVGSRAFRWQDGIWVDTAYDPETTPISRVAYLSEDYFLLAASRAEIAAALALGERVLVVVGDQAYEVVAEDAPVDTIAIPEPLEQPSADPSAVPQDPPQDPASSHPSSASSAGPCGSAFSLLVPILGLAILRPRRA